jgi:enoyl-CoA hydratase
MTLVLLEVHDGLAVVTLNDPRRRNAITVRMAEELRQACDAVDADASIGGLIVQGAGGYFCSGGDRDELAAICQSPASTTGIQMTSALYSAFLRVGQLAVPSVAVIRGGAVGAGLNLALATDVRVMAHDAVLASGFPHLGIHPGGGHLSLLGRLGGHQTAAVLGLMGESVTGPRAVELGLAWSSHPEDELEQQAARLLAQPAADPELTRAMKRSLLAELGPPAVSWSTAVEIERSPQMWSFARKGSAGWNRSQRAVQS